MTKEKQSRIGNLFFDMDREPLRQEFYILEAKPGIIDPSKLSLDKIGFYKGYDEAADLLLFQGFNVVRSLPPSYVEENVRRLPDSYGFVDHQKDILNWMQEKIQEEDQKRRGIFTKKEERGGEYWGKMRENLIRHTKSWARHEPKQPKTPTTRDWEPSDFSE